MKLRISKIAKIDKAMIDIDGITVIAGSNNTGKSTIGKALFAAFDAFYNLDRFVSEWKPRDAKSALKKHGDNLDFICKRLAGVSRRKLSYSATLQDRYKYIMAQCKTEQEIMECLQNYCVEHLNLYDIDSEEMISSEVQLWMKTASADISEILLNYDSEYAEKKGIENVFRDVFHDQIIMRDKKEAGIFDDGKDYLSSSVSIEVKDNNFNGKSRNKVIFDGDKVKSVDQEFIVYAKPIFIENPRVLDDYEILGRMDEFGARRRIEESLRPNRGRIRSFIYATEMDRNVESEITESNVEMKRMDEVIDEIDQQLAEQMNGSISFSEGNTKLYFKDNNYLEPFALKNLSTGLKAISLLQCILHYRVLKNKSVLILDEPEINLHPEWQVAYAKYVVMLQQKLNLHIVITTHSPFFLKAVENASKDYGVWENCHYYYATEQHGISCIECIDDNLEVAYTRMMKPLISLLGDMGL